MKRLKKTTKNSAKMETSDKEDDAQNLKTFLSEPGKKSYSSPSSTNSKSEAVNETLQHHLDEKSLKNEEKETIEEMTKSSAEQLDQINKLADGPEEIVMSPADFNDVMEELSARQFTSEEQLGTFKCNQEEKIQLSTVESHPSDDTNADGKSTERAADPSGKPVGEPKEPEDEIDHKSVSDANESSTSEDPDTEVVSKIRRRKSMLLSDDILKKESLEPYKIDIPLRKKINKSTKKKLWREIERRKPFITQNVIEHIQTYAKPPFITWGCRNCEFLYESQS